MDRDQFAKLVWEVAALMSAAWASRSPASPSRCSVAGKTVAPVSIRAGGVGALPEGPLYASDYSQGRLPLPFPGRV